MAKLINVVRDKFSVIPNEVFFDRRLDYRTRGILCTIFSLPNGWDFSTLGLVELVTPKDGQGNSLPEKNEGKAAIRSSLQKLEKLGYLERIRTKGQNGLFSGYDYRLNIPPIESLNNQPLSD